MPLAVLALFALAPQFVVQGDELGVAENGQFAPVYLRAVNVGSGMPGRFGSEHAIDRATYDAWLEAIADAEFNAVRVFDLESPAFYAALRAHNLGDPARALYLLQGVWLDESESADLYGKSTAFDAEIAIAIDAVHGAAEIGERRGRAFGRYRDDVSTWTLAWIIGRELSPAEVAKTDRARPEVAAFEGKFFGLERGTASERWLVERFEAAAAYEASIYVIGRPIAAVSWPPLDPLHHESARHFADKDPPGLDDVSIDVTRIEARAGAGHFAAYSVYPYYPEFIWRDKEHGKGRDAHGANSYLGYLERLKRHYRGMPLFVAEYGVPSSHAVISRDPVTKMSFGGASERAQGEQLARMTRNIAAAGCAGGALFSWADEWWKPTWILAAVSEPEALPSWHDTLSAEQNFGLVGFEAAGSAPASVGAGVVLEATRRGLRIAAPAAAEAIDIDIDGTGFDFRVVRAAGKARVVALEANGPRELAWQTREDSYDDQGAKQSALSEPVGELVEVRSDASAFEVVVPWSLLGFSDPGRRVAQGKTSPGVRVAVRGEGDGAATDRYAWSPWGAPRATERVKESLAIVSAALRDVSVAQTGRMSSLRTSARTAATGSLASARSRSSSLSTPSAANPRAAVKRTSGSGSAIAAAMSSASSRLPTASKTSSAKMRSAAVSADDASEATAARAVASSR